MTNAGKLRLSKLARIDQRLANLASERATIHAKEAELLAERASVFGEFVEVDADIETGRKNQAPHRPQFQPVSDIDRARAQQALRDADGRKRFGA